MQSLANFISSLVLIYTVLILVAVIFTWVRVPYSRWLAGLRDFVDSVTSPYLGFFRRFVPPLGGLDLSPMLALIVLQVVGGAVAGAVAGA
jgi:YggT family protein